MVAASWSAVRGRYPGPRCRGLSQDRARDGGRRGPGARPRRDRRRRRGAHLDLSALERDEALVLHAVERARDRAVRVAGMVLGVLGGRGGRQRGQVGNPAHTRGRAARDRRRGRVPPSAADVRADRRHRLGAGLPLCARPDGLDGTAGLPRVVVPAGGGCGVPGRRVRRVVPRALVPDRPEAHAAPDRPRHAGAHRRDRRRDRGDRDERVRRHAILRAAQSAAHGRRTRAVDRARDGGGHVADRGLGPSGAAGRARLGRAIRYRLLLPCGRDRLHRRDRRQDEVPAGIAMRAALIVVGIVAQMVAWWRISSGRVTVWQLMPFVLGAMGIAALLLMPPPERTTGVGVALAVGAGAGFALFLGTRVFVAIASHWGPFARHVEEAYREAAEEPVRAALVLSLLVSVPAEEIFYRGLV